MSQDPEWLTALHRDGFCVVPNVIPSKVCDEFQEGALSWLEGFPYGFKRDDKSTWSSECLPKSFTGGLYNRYAVNHEDFVWLVRQQPGIRKLYSEIYGTDDLIVSFDAMNVTFPIGEHGRKDIEITAPWPHMDQNTSRIASCQIYQGIAALSEIGPEDGGLVVVRGSYNHHPEFPFKEKNKSENGYHFSDEEELEWYKARGCEVVKVCCNKGDFIVWDSRTIHWNASPVGDRTRFATYVCMAPRNMMSQEALDEKLRVFKERKGTDGYPYKNNVPEEKKDPPTRPDGSLDKSNRSKPVNDPIETPEVLYLVGVRS